MELQHFNFNGLQLRSGFLDDNPIFIAKDVCDALGLGNTSQAASYLDEDEKGDIITNDTTGRPQRTLVVTESGLYSMILRSRMPEAKRFKKWVTSEVIPSIRKHGAYLTNQKLEEALLSPDTIIKLAQDIKTERAEKLLAQQKLLTATEKINADAPKVAFADAVAASKDCVLVKELAAYLNQNGIDTGEKRLYVTLRENGFLCSRAGYHNLPTQRAIDLKLFEVRKSSIVISDGTIRMRNTTLVTGKGMQYFLTWFKKRAA